MITRLSVDHAAFDLGIIGIRPDYVIEVREDVLKGLIVSLQFVL